MPRYYETVWGSEKKRGIATTRHLETGELEPELVKMLRLFNVRFVLSAMPMRSPAIRHVEATAEGMQIYEIDGWLPRAFVVGAVTRESSDDQALARLQSPAFEPEREAVAAEALSLPENAASSTAVEVTRRRNTEIALRASLAKPGLLILSEGYYPGWRATVDGVEAPVHRVNVMMRGVVLAAGEHEIVFRFCSKSIALGAVVSIVSLLLLLLARRRLVI